MVITNRKESMRTGAPFHPGDLLRSTQVARGPYARARVDAVWLDPCSDEWVASFSPARKNGTVSLSGQGWSGLLRCSEWKREAVVPCICARSAYGADCPAHGGSEVARRLRRELLRTTPTGE